jgi:hypothetical protein
MKGGADLDNSRPAPFFFGYYYGERLLRCRKDLSMAIFDSYRSNQRGIWQKKKQSSWKEQ